MNSVNQVFPIIPVGDILCLGEYGIFEKVSPTRAECIHSEVDVYEVGKVYHFGVQLQGEGIIITIGLS